MYVFPKSHDKSHFQELEPSAPSGSSTCSCLKPQPVPKQQRTGWSWHQWMVVAICSTEKVGWIPWGWALKHIWENPTWRKVYAITDHICYDDTDWKKLPISHLFSTKLYIYFQGSSKVVNIQFFTLFKPYHNCLEILKPKPRTNSPTVAPRSSPSNLRPEGPNSGSWQ